MAKALGASVSPPIAVTPEHDLGGFACGKPPLDDWLRQRALKSDGTTARTYVVCSSQTVVAYYALAVGSIDRNLVPSKMRRNAPEQIPVNILARLAVDARCHGQGIGRAMLKDALLRTLQLSRIAGVRALMVHAIDDDANRFYLKYGFLEFPAGTKTLFLPIETIEATI